MGCGTYSPFGLFAGAAVPLGLVDEGNGRMGRGKLRRAAVAVAGLALLAPLVGWAVAARVRGGDASEQVFATVSKKVVTDSRRWRTIPALTVVTDCNDDVAASADLSLQLAGRSRRASFRIIHDGYTVRGDEPLPMRPRRVFVDAPGRGPVLRDVVFVKTRLSDQHGERFRVQWRSVDGRRLLLTRGVLRLLWDPSEGTCA